MAARDMMQTPIRFGSDQGARRSEDEPLITGHGRFTDDLRAPDQVYAVFLRAQVGHAMAPWDAVSWYSCGTGMS